MNDSFHLNLFDTTLQYLHKDFKSNSKYPWKMGRLVGDKEKEKEETLKLDVHAEQYPDMEIVWRWEIDTVERWSTRNTKSTKWNA